MNALNRKDNPVTGAAKVDFRNNLWERCNVFLFNGAVQYYSSVIQNPFDVTLFNNLFWNNSLTLMPILSKAFP